MTRIQKLSLAAGIGAIACSGMGWLHRKAASNSIKNSMLFKEAMELVKQNKGVIYFLGLPIQEYNPYFANAGLLTSDSSDVKVKVSGPKSDGVVFISVVPEEGKEEGKSSLILDSVQVQIGKDDSKRLVVKKSSKKSN